MIKTVKIEYLFLDLKTCNRCIGTDLSFLVLAYDSCERTGYLSVGKRIGLRLLQSNQRYRCGRVFDYEGHDYEVPPKAMLAEAVLRGILAPQKNQTGGSYTPPDNLKPFFDGKKQKSGGCSCENNRCL